MGSQSPIVPDCMDEHLLMEIARHDEEVWELFSMLNKPLSKIFNTTTREKRFPKKYPDLPRLVRLPWTGSALYSIRMNIYGPRYMTMYPNDFIFRVTLPPVQSSGRVEQSPSIRSKRCAPRQSISMKTNRKYQKYENRKHLGTPQYGNKHSKKWNQPRKWY